MRCSYCLPALLLLLPLSTAQAESASDGRLADTEASYTQADASGHEAADRMRFGLHKRGLEMRKALDVGDRTLVFRVKGPIQKRKRLGLTFELRF